MPIDVRFDFDEVNGIWAVDYAISNDLKKVLMQVQGVVLWPCMPKFTRILFHLAVLCDSLRCGAYGTYCYGIS